MLVDIIKRNIFKNGPNNNIYLVDGFPRSAENYEAWKKVIGDEVEIKTLLYLDCKLETLEARLLERAKISGREDDNIDTIRKRFRTYNDQTKPFLEYYKRNVGEVHMVDGERLIAVVEAELKQILTNEHLLWKFSMITYYFIKFYTPFVYLCQKRVKIQNIFFYFFIHRHRYS